MQSVHVDLKPDFKMKKLKVGAGVCGKVARGDVICSGHLLPALQNFLWTPKGTNDIPSYGDLMVAVVAVSECHCHFQVGWRIFLWLQLLGGCHG